MEPLIPVWFLKAMVGSSRASARRRLRSRRAASFFARRARRPQTVCPRPLLLYNNKLVCSNRRGKLVADWLGDRRAALVAIAERKELGFAAPIDDAKRVAQAIFFVKDGCLSRAQARLSATGLLDSADPAIRAKLQSIHKARGVPMPVERPPEGERLKVKLREKCRSARRRAGPGPGGGMNEYLRVLGMQHADARSLEAVEKMEEFAELLINGDLPEWAYVAAMAARLIPIGKKARSTDQASAAVPPMRPITSGSRDLAVIMGATMDGLRPAFCAYLAPQQLCCGVKGAAEVLVHGLRTSTEHWENKVLLVLDIKAAFPSVSRAAIAARLPQVEGIGNYPRLFVALNQAGRLLFIDRAGDRLFEEGTPDRLGDADEGVGQGLATSMADFCVGVHDEVRNFDHDVQAADPNGLARFFANDGTAFGDPKAVLEAAVRFAKDLLANTGCAVECMHVYSKSYDLSQCPHRIAAEQALNIPIEVAGRADEVGVFHRGVVILGATIGSEQFESLFYEERASKTVSKIDHTVSLLQSTDAASLGALTFSCLSSTADYDLRLAASADSVRPLAEAVDDALLRAYAVSQLPSLLQDPLLVRRIRLPARRKGGGLRSRVELIPVASVAGFVDAARQFFDSAEKGPGFFNNLKDLFGEGAFEPGGRRFTGYIAAGGRHADSFAASWGGMRAELEHGADEEIYMGVLEDPVEMAGRTQVRPPPEDEESDSDKTKLRFQHHLADALERRRAHLLDTDFKRLPSIVLPGYAAGRGSAADPRLSAWMACDKVSRSVVHTHPTQDWAPTCAEFAEILSNYLGADSPLAARLGVGKVLRESRNTRVNPPINERYGFGLQNITVAGHHWAILHDNHAARIFSDALRAGMSGQTEVRSLFTDLLPPGSSHLRTGIRPDFVSGGVMYDLKFVRYQPKWYSLRHVLRQDAAGNRVLSPVDMRARQVNLDYHSEARLLDAQFYSDIPDPNQRPILARLLEYGEVKSPVVGAHGEFSKHAHELLDATIACAAEKHWRMAGARNLEQAKSIFALQLRRGQGCAAALGIAQLKAARAPFVEGARDPAGVPPARGGSFDPRSHANFARAESSGVGGGSHHRRAAAGGGGLGGGPDEA